MQADPAETLGFYYKGRPWDYTLLRKRLWELAGARVRYGYRRLMVVLRGEDINNCHNAVYQMYREENLGRVCKISS